MRRLEEIKNLRPDELKIDHFLLLIKEIERLEEDKARAISSVVSGALLIYADGNRVKYDLRKNGWKFGDEPPRYIYFQITKPISGKYIVDELPEPSMTCERAFKLYNIQNWDNMPIYKEVL